MCFSFCLSLKNDNFYPNVFSFKKTFFIFAPLLIEITILYITQHTEDSPRVLLSFFTKEKFGRFTTFTYLCANNSYMPHTGSDPM